MEWRAGRWTRDGLANRTAVRDPVWLMGWARPGGRSSQSSQGLFCEPDEAASTTFSPFDAAGTIAATGADATLGSPY